MKTNKSGFIFRDKYICLKISLFWGLLSCLLWSIFLVKGLSGILVVWMIGGQKMHFTILKPSLTPPDECQVKSGETEMIGIPLPPWAIYSIGNDIYLSWMGPVQRLSYQRHDTNFFGALQQRISHVHKNGFHLAKTSHSSGSVKKIRCST